MGFIVKDTIGRTFLARVRATPDRTAFRHKVGTEWVGVSFQQFHDEAAIASFGLMSLGVEPGDRVGLISSTRYEWTVFDFAIFGARGVTVPIYPSSTSEEIALLLNHSLICY